MHMKQVNIYVHIYGFQQTSLQAGHGMDQDTRKKRFPVSSSVSHRMGDGSSPSVMENGNVG